MLREAWLYYETAEISARHRRFDALDVQILAPGGAAVEAGGLWLRMHWLLLANTANLILFLGTFLYPRLAWASDPANYTGKVKLRTDGSWRV